MNQMNVLQSYSNFIPQIYLKQQKLIKTQINNRWRNKVFIKGKGKSSKNIKVLDKKHTY